MLGVDRVHLDIRCRSLAGVLAERADRAHHALCRRRLDGAFPFDVVVVQEDHILSVPALEQTAFD